MAPRGSVEGNHLARLLAATKAIEGSVEVGQRDAAADNLVQQKLSCQVARHEAWHVLEQPRGAEVAAPNSLLLDEWAAIQRELRAGAHEPDHDGFTANGQRRPGLLDRLRATDGLERVVDAATCQVADRRDRVGLRGAHDVCRSQDARKAQLLGSHATATIGAAPAIRAPWTTFRPTPPQPKTATL